MRFEDFCLALIYPLNLWTDLRHYGRKGTDGGVDIFAKERGDDGVEREWIIQCRRHSRSNRSKLKAAVDDALSKADKPPAVLLVIIACDARRDAHENFLSYASTRGVKTPYLWTASLLEAKLYNKRRDLLYTFFGISEVAEERSKETSISRNIAMKKRVRRDFLADPANVNWDKARNHPPAKFQHGEVIIHSIDDTVYPQADADSPGISGWFKLEVWDFYHNGLEFVLAGERGALDRDGYWGLLDRNQSFDSRRFREVRLYRLGRIPYANIVEYDVVGDEFYGSPHLYCRFANGGMPYEGFRHVLIADEFPWPMEAAKQIDVAMSSSKAHGGQR